MMRKHREWSPYRGSWFPLRCFEPARFRPS